MTAAVFYTRYDADGASSRTRAFDYVQPLGELGIDATVVPRTAPGAFEEVLCRAEAGAVVVLQKPSLTFAQLDALAGAPLLADFDDAIWMGYGGGEVPPLRRRRSRHLRSLSGSVEPTPVDGIAPLHATLRRARAVTTGSRRLAAWAGSVTAGPVEVLPPSLDPGRYRLRAHAPVERPLLVWIGSAGNLRDLGAAEPALRLLVDERLVRLRLIADEPLPWPGVEFARWSAADEASVLAEADIGVMPLHDDERTGGRCGYKAVQYQAAGLPVVASPVLGPVEAVGAGLLASTDAEWRQALMTLAQSPELRAELGAAGRRHVEERHSLAGTARRLAELIRSCL